MANKLNHTTIPITKAINAKQLLGELAAQGISGGIIHTKTGFALAIPSFPAGKTEADVEAIITAHVPVATPAVNHTTAIHGWGSLTAADKDALLLATVKKVWGVS